MSRSSSDPLPIEQIRSELVSALERDRRVILQAPTGSGKSTQVPQFLVDDGAAGDGLVIVLQPRRIAARLLAKRVAEERGAVLGQEVGYQYRLEKRIVEADAYPLCHRRHSIATDAE